MSMSMSMYINVEMPDCPACGQSSTGLKKLMMPEQVLYRTKLSQFGIFLVWYLTKIQGAGMPMPGLFSLVSMPIYDELSVGRVLMG